MSVMPFCRWRAVKMFTFCKIAQQTKIVTSNLNFAVKIVEYNLDWS